MKSRKTLFAFKISSTRRTKELGSLGLIFLGLALFLGLVGAAQYHVCQKTHPGRAIRSCLRAFAPLVALALISCSTTTPEVVYLSCKQQIKTEQLRWAKALKACRSERDACRMLLEEDCE